jgi:carbon storage regulator CsrA
MLVLSRYEGEEIVIDDDIVILVHEICPAKPYGRPRVRLCISAPKSIKIMRRELLDYEGRGRDRTP